MDWIETAQPDRDLHDEAVHCCPRPPVARELDRYKGIVVARLADSPPLNTQWLFDELCASGYEGRYTQLKDQVCEVRLRIPAKPGHSSGASRAGIPVHAGPVVKR